LDTKFAVSKREYKMYFRNVYLVRSFKIDMHLVPNFKNEILFALSETLHNTQLQNQFVVCSFKSTTNSICHLIKKTMYIHFGFGMRTYLRHRKSRGLWIDERLGNELEIVRKQEGEHVSRLVIVALTCMYTFIGKVFITTYNNLRLFSFWYFLPNQIP
jgi:hypothetical protein